MIVGRVIDEGGQPVGGAIVTLTTTFPQSPTTGSQVVVSNLQRRVMTEPGGGFVFNDLPVGRYILIASKSGFADGGFGRRRPAGEVVPLEVADSARLGDVTIKMWKFGALVGTVSDEFGEPIVGLTVQALAKRYRSGRAGLTRVASASTDDRGAYRIANLLPGDYIIVVPSTTITLPGEVIEEYGRNPSSLRAMMATIVTPASLTPTGSVANERIGDFVVQGGRGLLPVAADGRAVYPTSFYASAVTPREATVIALGSGETRSALDLQIRTVQAVRVSGTLRGPGGPIPFHPVRLAAKSLGDDTGQDAGLDTAIAISDRSGIFTFIGVPPAQYVLHAAMNPRTSGSAGPAALTGTSLWAQESIVVGAKDLSVDVTMNPSLSVSGSLVFDTRRPPNATDSFRVTVESADGRVKVNAQEQNPRGFVASGFPAGRYFIRAGTALPSGWALKSAILEGRDVADTGFDLKADTVGVVVTFTDTLARVSGTVRTSEGAPARDAIVIAFPSDQTGWIDFGLNPRRIRSVPVDGAGTYVLSSLPEGDYLFAAVIEDQVTEWAKPSVFQALSRSATRVHVPEAGQVTAQLLLTISVR